MWLEFPEIRRVVNMDNVAEVRIDNFFPPEKRGKCFWSLVIMYANGMEQEVKRYEDRELAENALCAVKLAVKNNS